jgi:hypothetical protein
MIIFSSFVNGVCNDSLIKDLGPPSAAFQREPEFDKGSNFPPPAFTSEVA